MIKNIHPFERVFRVLAGVAITSFTVVGPASPWFLLGLIPITTGLLGWCPPYQLLGINTCKVKTAKPHKHN